MIRKVALRVLCIYQCIYMTYGAKLTNIRGSIDENEQVNNYIRSRHPKFGFGVSIVDTACVPQIPDIIYHRNSR